MRKYVTKINNKNYVINQAFVSLTFRICSPTQVEDANELVLVLFTI
jgi:hypothetical protein